MNQKTVLKKKAREAALRALVRVEEDRAYLNLALPALVKNMDPEERALAVHLARGTMQRLNTLDWSVSLFSHRQIHTLTPWVRNLLRLSAYQLIYLDRVPAYAVLDQAVNLARRFGHRGVAGLVNAVLRKLAREADSLPWPERGQDPLQYLSITYSQPQWIISRVIERMGLERAEQWCRSNLVIPNLSVRPNQMRINPEELIGRLETEGFQAEHSRRVPGILQITSGGSPASAGLFKAGLFSIQGESSALVAPLLNPQPEEMIVDLCSAPGGKTTHLAELSKDRGLIYAVDLHQSRLQMVKKAARRLGLQSVNTLLADGRTIAGDNFSTITAAPAAVLVDAPCSGLGVIRRLPEIKWRRSLQDLSGFQELQTELLQAAARLLPVGGRLLYSVCTNEPEETRQVVERFNREHKQFALQKVPALLPAPLQREQEDQYTALLQPDLHGLDGFFIALWIKER